MTLFNRRAPLALLIRQQGPLCQPANGSLSLRVAIRLLALTGIAVLILGPLTASVQADGPQAVPDVPDKPKATAIYEGMLDLEWNEVPGATSYDVQAFYSDWFDLPGNGVELAFYGPGAIIKGLTPESRYYFRVRASNSLGSSEWSEHLFVSPTGGDFGNWDGVPEPTNSTATGIPTIGGTAQVGKTLTADISGIEDENGLDRVKFHYQWVSIDGTDEEDIEGGTDASYVLVADDEGRFIKVRWKSENEEYSPSREVLASDLSYTVRELTNGVEYTVQVMAVNEVGDGEAAEIAATPRDTIPPELLTARVNGPTITLTYDEALDANSTPPTSAFSVLVSGTAREVSEVYISGSAVSLTLASAVTLDDTVSLSYSAPQDTGEQRVQDTAGNDAGSHSEEPVENDTPKPNTGATGAPTISGTTHVGETLTAAVTGIADEDGLTNVVFAYQWARSDGSEYTDIAGATGVTYTLVGEDEGKTIKVTVSFTDAEGNEETRISGPTNPVAATAPDAPDRLNVWPHDENALDLYWEAPASHGGSPVTGYKVQWKEAVDSWDTLEDVSEETVTGTTHTISGLTEGMEYAVRVIATNQVGEGPASAEKTAFPREIRAPLMVRSRVDGATLRVLYDEVLDEGSAPLADAFDVRVTCRCDNMIWRDEEARRAVDMVSVNGDTVVLTLASPATAEDYVVISYNPPSDEASPRLQDAAGNPAAAIRPTEVFNDTEETAESDGHPNSPVAGAPTIDGIAQVGQVLSVGVTGIDDEDGLTNVVFAYQWARSDGTTYTNIQGATGATYTLVEADEGKTITVTVSFTDDAGNPEKLSSDATAAAAAKPNSDATGAPTITGTVRVGETLTADTTSIADDDGLDNATFSYQWVRNDGTADTKIQGATSETYELSGDEVGNTIKVRVFFTDDAAFKESRTSEPTGEVVPLGTCLETDSTPTPTAVDVGVVPIVVESTTDEYFVLYVRHEMNADNSVEVPVAVVLGEEGTTILAENVSALPKERYRVEKFLIADPADVDGDCIDDIIELADSISMNPVNAAAAIDLSDGAVVIPDQGTLEKLSRKGGSVFKNQPFLKFVLVGTHTDRPGLYFINTRTHPHHLTFLDEVLDLNVNSPGVISGQIGYDPELTAPNGSLGLYWYSTGARSRSYYSFSQMARSYTMLAASMPLLEDNLSYFITNYTLRHHQPYLPSYRASRINLVFDEDIFGEISFLALNPGEGYGLLRVMKPDERPNPRDVVIYEALPNELPRVAGIISSVPQTPLSHVNLRAVQGRLPNSFISDALGNTDITYLIGKYVHYTVAEDGWNLRAATPAEVDAHYAVSRPAAEQSPERDLSVTQITALSDIEFDDWNAFGVKAANVAVLQTLGFPAGTVPDGFAVPFYFYDEFMEHNGFYDDIEEMLADEDFQSDFDTQESELKKLRKKIKKGDTPEWMTKALENIHAAFPEGTSLRYRSSTNNEDLPGFNGAGLYDSKTQHPKETEEDGIDKSLKQVYASLWNFRAFAEREFNRINHLAAAMGVLVHPNYSDELANGVAVSFDPITNRDGYYYVNTQTGEDLVTNPEVDSVPEEILLFEYRPSGCWEVWKHGYEILATSNQMPRGQLLMSEGQMDQLRRHLEVIHNHFESLHNPVPDEPFAMEIEFKITSDNILAIKQARPWIFSDAPLPNNALTGLPTIVGIVRVGQRLSVDTSAIADEDGLNNVEYTYQWIRNDGCSDTDIAVATGDAYTLVADDEGKAIKVKVTFTDDGDTEETLTSDPTAAVEPVLTGFTVVDTSSDPDDEVGTLVDGATIALDKPSGGSYGIRADTSSNDNIKKVKLVLSGAKSEDRDEGVAPYSLYGDSGENNLTGESLPVGSYTLTATAYDDNDDVLGTLTVSFTVEEQTAVPNAPATGAPAIVGIARVGGTLEADTSGISDADGLNNSGFTYQWLADDADIEDATNADYTLVEDDEGKTISVEVTFTDDEGNTATLTSEATGVVTSAAGPLIGFSLVDASDPDKAVLWRHRADGSTPEEADEDVTWEEWTDGGMLVLPDPENGSYGITVDTESDDGIDRVALELTPAPTGEEKAERTDDAAPYSLYEDENEGEDNLNGESLRVGEYTLTATAYTSDGAVLGTLEVSFTVEQLALPGMPQDLKADASAQTISLTWKAPEGSAVTRYVVYRGELQNGSMTGRPMTKYATIDATGNVMAYIDDDVEEGQQYRYRVAAVNDAGEGKKSTWINIFANDPQS